MKKILVIIIGALFVSFLSYKIYTDLSGPQQTTDRTAMPAQAVSVEPVQKHTLYHTAELTGTLIPENEYIAASKVSGRLEKLHINIGDVVKRGDIIAQLDSDEFMQQVQVAQAELEVAQASLGESAGELTVSQRELERALRLMESGSLSQSELDQIQANYDVRKARHEVAKAQIRQKQAALEAARVRLAYTSIKASWTGGSETRRVGRRFANEGTMLQANEPIVSIICTRSLIAVVNVIERDFPFINIGQSAQVSVGAYPGKTYPGTVIRFAPVLEETSRQGRVEVLIENSESHLAPGMFARIRLEFDRYDNATAIPAVAVTRRQGQQGVFMADTKNMKAGFVPITAGVEDNKLIQVIEPELEGYVVTLGNHLLEDGMSIMIPEISAQSKDQAQ